MSNTATIATGTTVSDTNGTAVGAAPSAGNAVETCQPGGSVGGGVDPAQKHSLFESFVPIILMIAAFYFLIMRPQQKRDAKVRQLRNSVKRGDKIITAGGIIGTIHKIISDREVSLEISENVRMRILKASIAEVVGKAGAVEKATESIENENTFDNSTSEEKDIAVQNVNNNKAGAARKIAPNKRKDK